MFNGDEALYNDGRLSATGNWEAFITYVRHPAVSPLLQDYDLGSSNSEAKHAIILDQEKHEVFIAPVKAVQTFLTKQWPPEPSLLMSQEEELAQLSEMLRNVKQPDDVDIEEIQRRIDEQYALTEQMQNWLDQYLKN
jgi:hypothetical protein